MKIAGLDIGTTGCKCTVFDENGKFLSREYKDYPLLRNLNEQEVDANAILNGVIEVLKKSFFKYPDIEGLGITSFGETFVLTDEIGNPLCNSFLYTDPKGKEEVEELKNLIGEDKISFITGLKPHEMYSLPKLMWLKRNKSELFKKAKYIFLISDFIAYHLTGKRNIDYSLACRTMAFDINNLTWNDEILKIANINKEMFSTPVKTGSIVGNIKESLKKEFNINDDCKVILAGHDQVAACIGSGVFSSFKAVDGAGTVQCLTPVFNIKPDVKELNKNNFCLVPYLNNTYVTYAFSYTGGALIEWCINTFAKKEKEIANKLGISINEYLENLYIEKHKNSNDLISNLLVLPHFQGAATPYMDTGSKGAIIGLTLDTKVEDIYVACMEAVAYEMKLNIDYLGDSFKEIKEIYATGGGSKSKFWMQMKADILNLPITSLKVVDAGTIGCAMLSGVAANIFSDLNEAAKSMIKADKTYYPNKEMNKKYMETYKIYKNLYKSIRPLIKGE